MRLGAARLPLAGRWDATHSQRVSLLAFAERLNPDVSDQLHGKSIGLQFASVLTAAQAGAEWAWTLLYRAMATPILGYLRAQGADDPEGLLGDVFLQVARNISSFQGDEAAFRSWLFVVAHHRVLDERRRRRRRPAVPVADLPEVIGGSTEDEALSGLLTGEVVDAMNALTPEQRDVVLLRVLADLSLEEVSTVVNRPVSAVKALQRRAYAQLRKKLADSRYPGEPFRR